MGTCETNFRNKAQNMQNNQNLNNKNQKLF